MNEEKTWIFFERAQTHDRATFCVTLFSNGRLSAYCLTAYVLEHGESKISTTKISNKHGVIYNIRDGKTQFSDFFFGCSSDVQMMCEERLDNCTVQ